ncbi:YfgM family protein [Ferrimonas balearica]|uniref:YfgM family protein n=1 Tax=Ferrimonas balearica TaxID=44012 RepID=UPI002D7F7A51|nr:tetratricopeptide repeat protein [Ferrimonas balearica]MBY6017443.1 tetratricopeptide repeat protein [Halomonas denitrificans]MBY6093708.1 tetratricopeptide repeat protein [Ferrimonas balearica]
MEIYSTEEQQVEAIKKFWKEYGVSIVGGAVLGLGGLFGWNTYQDHLVGKAEQASAAYGRVIEQAGQSPDALDTAVAQFQNEYGESGYGPLSQLLLARAAVEAGDLAKAETLLTEVLPSMDSATAPMVTLRLARVQLAQDKLDAAQATLEKVTSEAFAAQREELKGDVLVKKGEMDAARAAYQSALDAGGAQTSPALQMKLDDLA